MAQYEYKVVPAPARPGKVKGARGPAERFAASLAAELNAEATEGWEFLRAETLPVEERSGLTGTTAPQPGEADAGAPPGTWVDIVPILPGRVQ